MLNLALASQYKNTHAHISSLIPKKHMAGPFQTMKTQPMFPQNSGFARQGHALLVRSGSGPGAEILVPHVAWLEKNTQKSRVVLGGGLKDLLFWSLLVFGEWSKLTNLFQKGWKLKPTIVVCLKEKWGIWLYDVNIYIHYTLHYTERHGDLSCPWCGMIKGM